MHGKAEIRIAVEYFQERPITAEMCIGQNFWKITNGLVGVNAKKQGDGLRHRVIIEREGTAESGL